MKSFKTHLKRKVLSYNKPKAFHELLMKSDLATNVFIVAGLILAVLLTYGLDLLK